MGKSVFIVMIVKSCWCQGCRPGSDVWIRDPVVLDAKTTGGESPMCPICTALVPLGSVGCPTCLAAVCRDCRKRGQDGDESLRNIDERTHCNYCVPDIFCMADISASEVMRYVARARAGEEFAETDIRARMAITRLRKDITMLKKAGGEAKRPKTEASPAGYMSPEHDEARSPASPLDSLSKDGGVSHR